MARSLLVAPADEDVGLARTCLGLLRALDRSGIRVDYVKPVAQPRADGAPGRSAALVAAVTTLRPPEPLGTAELERQLGEGGLDVILEKIVAAWAPLRTALARHGLRLIAGVPHRPELTAVHTTANTVRPALQILGTMPGTRLVSSVFMCLPDGVVIYGDCAINPQPAAEDLADIAISSAATARPSASSPGSR